MTTTLYRIADKITRTRTGHGRRCAEYLGAGEYIRTREILGCADCSREYAETWDYDLGAYTIVPDDGRAPCKCVTPVRVIAVCAGCDAYMGEASAEDVVYR